MEDVESNDLLANEAFVGHGHYVFLWKMSLESHQNVNIWSVWWSFLWCFSQEHVLTALSEPHQSSSSSSGLSLYDWPHLHSSCLFSSIKQSLWKCLRLFWSCLFLLGAYGCDCWQILWLLFIDWCGRIIFNQPVHVEGSRLGSVFECFEEHYLLYVNDFMWLSAASD